MTRKFVIRRGLEVRGDSEVQGDLEVQGSVTVAAVAETLGGQTVKVLIKDGDGDAVLVTGETVPADGQAGFAKGCLFIDTNVAAGTTGLYVNVGTTAAADFDAVSDA